MFQVKILFFFVLPSGAVIKIHYLPGVKSGQASPSALFTRQQQLSFGHVNGFRLTSFALTVSYFICYFWIFAWCWSTFPFILAEASFTALKLLLRLRRIGTFLKQPLFLFLMAPLITLLHYLTWIWFCNLFAIPLRPTVNTFSFYGFYGSPTIWSHLAGLRVNNGGVCWGIFWLLNRFFISI